MSQDLSSNDTAESAPEICCNDVERAANSNIAVRRTNKAPPQMAFLKSTGTDFSYSDHAPGKKYRDFSFEAVDDTESSESSESSDDSWIHEEEIIGRDPKENQRGTKNLAMVCVIGLGCIIVVATLSRALVQPTSTDQHFELRIDAGSDTAYVDEVGRTWLADTGKDGSFDNVDSMFYVEGESNTYDRCHEDNFISDTGRVGSSMYCSERYFTGNGIYEVRVPISGWFLVTLHFAEILFSSEGDREFDIIVDGHIVRENYDIVREVGASYVADRVNTEVLVEDGSLEVQLKSRVENAKITGIEVIYLYGKEHRDLENQ